MTCRAYYCDGKLKYQCKSPSEDGDYYVCTKCGSVWKFHCYNTLIAPNKEKTMTQLLYEVAIVENTDFDESGLSPKIICVETVLAKDEESARNQVLLAQKEKIEHPEAIKIGVRIFPFE